LKPTYGRISRYGIIAFASSLDQAGPMTKTIRDAAISLESVAGVCEMDGNAGVISTSSHFGEAAATQPTTARKTARSPARSATS
jgi:aspartyl-tRNA(Asn)/glutamyl-tRNA(Gln) amidotransferase subunit A